MGEGREALERSRQRLMVDPRSWRWVVHLGSGGWVGSVCWRPSDAANVQENDSVRDRRATLVELRLISINGEDKAKCGGHDERA